jgi:hypothetical protein
MSLRRGSILYRGAVVCMELVMASSGASAGAGLPFISADGARYVNDRGEAVLLKGCNLGNYFVLESWMFGGTLGAGSDHSFRDGAMVRRILRQRFGDKRLEHLQRLYREAWIEPRDFKVIRSFGFNVVRLPFDYRLVQEENAPYSVKADGYAWLDRLVAMAREAGVYVVLDLHGTPGGQSMEDHTGEAGQDHLWTSREDQARTVEVWRQLAEHFKNESTVAAYDLINEPYGNHAEDCRPVLARLLPEIYAAIRGTGDRHIVFFPGALNGGIGFYGNPHERGMSNVAFTEHYYPGMFGSVSALHTQARVLNQELPAKQAYLQAIASPYYVGEFNVVLESEWPARLMRAYCDRLAEYGWAGTMWSYKLLSVSGGVNADAWYMATNAEPLATVDLNSSSYEEFERFFEQLGTMPLAVNERLREAVTAEHPPALYLADFPRLAAVAPKDPPPLDPSGYTSTDIGGAPAGYTRAGGGGGVVVMGGGTDIFGASDACRFVWRPIAGSSADIRATIDSLQDSGEYAKAGVMARWGEVSDSGAAMAMVNVFPDGTVALVTRPRAGGGAKETKVAAGVSFPVELRLQISAGRAIGMFRSDQGEWQRIGSMPVARQAGFAAGLVVCAHMDAALTTVKAHLDGSADSAVPAAGSAVVEGGVGPSLLANGSFEQAGASGDVAAGWNRWGAWMNRETGWTPTRSGSCEIGYHHWQVETAENSGLWQDVSVEPGGRYTFSIFAQRDIPHGGQNEAKSVELRLEAVMPQGQVTLNSRTFDVSGLAAGKWTRLTVEGTAETRTMRVLVVVNPAERAPRGAALKFDDAALVADGQ